MSHYRLLKILAWALAGVFMLIGFDHLQDHEFRPRDLLFFLPIFSAIILESIDDTDAA